MTRHDRDGGQVGIKTQAAHNVGEINPACLDANPDFASFGLRVGRFFHLENFRRANLRDPNLSHDRDLGVPASSWKLYKNHLEDSRMTTNGSGRASPWSSPAGIGDGRASAAKRFHQMQRIDAGSATARTAEGRADRGIFEPARCFAFR
jgi:hypothetical protein